VLNVEKRTNGLKKKGTPGGSERFLGGWGGVLVWGVVGVLVFGVVKYPRGADDRGRIEKKIVALY